MLDVIVEGDWLRLGERLAVSFHRTLRIPDDGRTYPLPPGFGLFPMLSPAADSDAPTSQSLIPRWASRAPPRSRAYTAAGLPWFDLYDEAVGSMAPDEATELKTIGERDRELSVAAADRPFEVSVSQITVINRGTADHPTGAQRTAAGEQSPPTASPREPRARRRVRKPQDRRN